MTARGERISAAQEQSAADVKLGDLRQHLTEMLALAHTAEKPRPTAINRAPHPMPGMEWQITDAMRRKVYDHYNRERSGWLIRAVDQVEDADCVYVSTPDAMDGEDFMAIPTTTARQLAMAILAACDRADSVMSEVPSLDSWRAKKTPPTEGDQMT